LGLVEPQQGDVIPVFEITAFTFLSRLTSSQVPVTIAICVMK
jgi:hypothetical protein